MKPDPWLVFAALRAAPPDFTPGREHFSLRHVSTR
jgi:hypothetical protein